VVTRQLLSRAEQGQFAGQRPTFYQLRHATSQLDCMKFLYLATSTYSIESHDLGSGQVSSCAQCNKTANKCWACVSTYDARSCHSVVFRRDCTNAEHALVIVWSLHRFAFHTRYLLCVTREARDSGLDNTYIRRSNR